ncbi:MAG TPA: aldo/keto reductase [bacterium]|nr:aldo/keto reductase [bacterium]
MFERRRLGATNLAVSLLGFGGIPIMRISTAGARDVVQAALEEGIDFFDTARGYADSEQKIGKALRELGARPVLASKSPKRDKQGMLEDVAASLAALGVDSIDLYQLHCVSDREAFDQVLGPGGACEALRELRAEGRVRHVGITTHNLDIARLAIECAEFETIQILFNVIEDRALAEVIPSALKADMGVIAMKPFGGGVIDQWEIALRWVLSTGGIVAIPGVASVSEVRENAAIARTPRPLRRRELEGIAAIKASLGPRFCRRCDYCQPCPNGVPISMLLQVDAIRKRLGEPALRAPSWQDVLKKAVDCDQCGTCEPRCPFELPIRELVKQARENLIQILD